MIATQNISPLQLALLHRLSENSLSEKEAQILDILFKKVHNAFQKENKTEINVAPELKEELLDLGILLVDNQDFMINSIKEDIDIEVLKLKQNYHPEKAKAIFGQFQMTNEEHQSILAASKA